MATNSTYMGLVLWSSGSDPYDHNQLVANWNKVDAHDHSSTKGKQIPTAGLADGSVTAAKIAAGTITSDKFSPGAVTVADGSVDAAKIAGSLKPSGTASPTTEALRAIGSTAGTVVAGNDSRLTNSRTPTAHAASHIPGGSDALYATGSGNGTTDGTGALTVTVSHGLGVVPSFAAVEVTSGIQNYEHYLVSKTTTVATFSFNSGAGFSPITFIWIAFR